MQKPIVAGVEVRLVSGPIHVLGHLFRVGLHRPNEVAAVPVAVICKLVEDTRRHVQQHRPTAEKRLDVHGAAVKVWEDDVHDLLVGLAAVPRVRTGKDGGPPPRRPAGEEIKTAVTGSARTSAAFGAGGVLQSDRLKAIRADESCRLVYGRKQPASSAMPIPGLAAAVDAC